MKTTIANLSNERLESEIANVYYRAFEENPCIRVVEKEGSLLALLWDEFQHRFDYGLIERNPLTGDEVDHDDV